MYKSLETGRSMIEMLGVLAIIAVLSVGGIAGYSKAMETYKLNRLVEQYAYLFRGLIEHRDSLVVTTSVNTSIKEAVSALRLIPPSWNTDYDFAMCKDEAGNNLNLLSRGNELVIDLGLKSGSDFSSKACEKLMNRLFQPLHASIHRIHFFDLGRKNQQFFYWGDISCSSSDSCLNNMSVAAINQVCGYCSVKEDSNCFLVIYF